MNDERFFDLAMKVIARQCSDAERAELNALLAGQPELKAEFERLRAEVGVAKEALPLVNATEATAGELPAYARGRLQTKVRQTLGRAAEQRSSRGWNWRWLVGLAGATAVVLLMMPLLMKPREPVIEVAMLDTAGGTRSAETNQTLLQQRWKDARVFSKSNELEAWQKLWPANSQRSAKIIYDPAAGEVRVLVRLDGTISEKAFPVEKSLSAALDEATKFVRERFGR